MGLLASLFFPNTHKNKYLGIQVKSGHPFIPLKSSGRMGTTFGKQVNKGMAMSKNVGCGGNSERVNVRREDCDVRLED